MFTLDRLDSRFAKVVAAALVSLSVATVVVVRAPRTSDWLADMDGTLTVFALLGLLGTFASWLGSVAWRHSRRGWHASRKSLMILGGMLVVTLAWVIAFAFVIAMHRH
jgi:hypothetical protein